MLKDWSKHITRHLPLSVLAALLAAALAATAALALASGPPDHDTYVGRGQPDQNFDGQDLLVATISNPDPADGGCVPTHIVYVQWDLSDVPDGETIQTATLTLTARYASNTGSATLSLYQTGDGWTEGALKYNNAPAVGALIETVTAPPPGNPPSPATVTFDSAALLAYISSQAADDDVASFALRFDDGCVSGAAATVVVFEDRESSLNGPHLQLRNPNAVRAHSFRSATPNPWWVAALVAGLGRSLHALSRPVILRCSKSCQELNLKNLRIAQSFAVEHKPH